MNIAQTTITYPPALGGLDRSVKDISEGLTQRGHRVVVVTTDLEQPLSRRRISTPSGYRDLAEVHRLSTIHVPKLAFPIAQGLQQVLKRGQPDVIHTHCLLHSTAYLSWRFASRHRTPLVISTIFSPRSGVFWRAYGICMRQMMRDAACVIAISEFERNLLVKAGLPAQRVTILAPGVDLEPLRTSRPLNYEKYGFDRGQRVIVSLGRLALGKRVDRLISAMPEVLKRHPEARLLIIGPDYGDLTRLRDLASSLKLTGVIRFAGALPADDVAAALQHAWAFAMTTEFELFGITLIEAMAAGTAVVAPNVASVPNVVTDGETGLLYTHDDVEDLAQKLIRVLGDDSLRLRLIESGKAAAARRFNFQENLDVLEEIYRKSR